jgi:hypothetical protein
MRGILPQRTQGGEAATKVAQVSMAPAHLRYLRYMKFPGAIVQKILTADYGDERRWEMDVTAESAADAEPLRGSGF